MNSSPGRSIAQCFIEWEGTQRWNGHCWEMLVLGWVIGMPSWTPLRGQPQTARRSSRMASDLLRFSSFLGFLLISFLFFDTQLSTCLSLSPFYPLSLGWCHPVSLSDSRRSERCDCSSKVCPEITSRCTGIVNNRWRIQRRVHRVNDTEINRKKSGGAGGREETGKGRNWRFLTSWRVRENQQFIVFPDRPILSHEPCIHTHMHALLHAHSVYILTSVVLHVHTWQEMWQCDILDSLVSQCSEIQWSTKIIPL